MKFLVGRWIPGQPSGTSVKKENPGLNSGVEGSNLGSSSGDLVKTMVWIPAAVLSFPTGSHPGLATGAGLVPAGDIMTAVDVVISEIA